MPENSTPPNLLCVSGETEFELRKQASILADLIEANHDLGLGNICETINTNSRHPKHRLVCIGEDHSSILNQLEAYELGGPNAATDIGAVSNKSSSRQENLAFMFAGQGSQHVGMAHSLYTTHSVFREAFQRCSILLDPLLDRPLASVLYPEMGQADQAAELIKQTAFTQPALFVLGYALSELWSSWGIRPDYLIGHSVGEIMAAYLAGVFSLEDALKIVTVRSKLMQSQPSNGGMLMLVATPEEVRELISNTNGGCNNLVIAAYNGPSNTVVSGPMEALNQLLARTTSNSIKTKRLEVSHAFYSAAMNPLVPELKKTLCQINFQQPMRPLVSNVTGRQAGPEIANSNYWCDHVTSPVHFAQGMNTLAANGVRNFMELGANSTLLNLGRQCLKNSGLANIDKCNWWPSPRYGKNNWEVILRSVAEIYSYGYQIDWKSFYTPMDSHPISLEGFASNA